MFARVSTLEGSVDSLDTGIAAVSEQVWPAIQGMDGCQGILALADRSSGKMVAVTLWESEEALRASEEAANRLRADTADASSAQIAGVERFEVVFDRRM